MHARHLGTLLTPALTLGLSLGLASTLVLVVGHDDSRPATIVTSGADVVRPLRAAQSSLDAGLARRRGAPGGATAVVHPGRFSQVAVTWRGPLADGPDLAVSTHTRGGTWTAWRPLEPLDDEDADETNGRHGTELAQVADADAVRVRARGGSARDLEVVTIDPGLRRSDTDPGAVVHAQLAPAAATSTATSTASPAAATATATSTATATPTSSTQLSSPPAYTPPSHYAPRPTILFRSAWGADETWRKEPQVYNRTIQDVHVHHTDSVNSYTRAEVPGMIRAMYWYHTHSLGWNDIGYNFLIDRFGRIWEGRYGGVVYPVRGAHTLGFNATSVGISMIGNFQKVQPSKDAVTALVKLIAWKLDYWRRKPGGSSYVLSEGSDKYAAGRWVWLRTIDGHRDTNDTACPGYYLYEKLPGIRKRVVNRVYAY